MGIVTDLLLVLHILGLVLGVGAGMAMLRVRPIMAGANDEQRSVLFIVGQKLGGHGLVGLAILWITGPLLVWLEYDGFGELNAWFWVKIVLVVILSAAIGVGSKAFRLMRAGDMSMAPRAKMAGKIGSAAGVAIIFCAVFAFN